MTEKFAHKKSLGQHFLNSDYVPKKMCDAAGLFGEGEGDGEKVGEGGREAAAPTTVLEIGPGTGILTREILARGARVIAVEADPRAITSLQESFKPELENGRLKLHHHDARKLNPSDFGLEDQGYIVVSNIPYYLSGQLFRQLIDTDTQPKTLVFLIQKELAERIARDKKESLLSLSIKAFGAPSYICTVKRNHFTPPPKVDSAIIAVRNISRRNFSEISPTDFFHLLHLGFGQKRKQLLGNLASEFSRDHLVKTFSTLSLSPTVRAEDVPISTWLSLTSTFFPQLH